MAKNKGNTLKVVPVKAVKLKKIFIKLGFDVSSSRSGGSHIVVTGKNLPFPIAFGNHPSAELSPVVIKMLIKKANITEKQYLNIFNSL